MKWKGTNSSLNWYHLWIENPSQWTILEPLCYSSFVFATIVHGVIGYKFCWSLPQSRSTNWTWISWYTDWAWITTHVHVLCDSYMHGPCTLHAIPMHTTFVHPMWVHATCVILVHFLYTHDFPLNDSSLCLSAEMVEISRVEARVSSLDWEGRMVRPRNPNP